MEQLFGVPEDVEIDFLYSLIRQDPEIFQSFEQTQFVDTPLHVAASEGRRQLALEIQRLMPSFGTKINPDGFSPLDLAMRRGHTETVRAMVNLNSQLVRVQGREGLTPLHYAAQTDDVDLLSKFLLSCPDSINDLTIRGESAVHVAVKNGNLAAFRVFLGWLKRTGRTHVLRWTDFQGNTILHLAASNNQTKVMELAVKQVDVNIKNLKGLTALDKVNELGPEVNAKALKILQSRRAKRGSSIDYRPEFSTVANYLSSPINIIEKTLKFDAYLDTGLPKDMRNTILVVAVLIATAMYQAVLSPPGGGVLLSGHEPVPDIFLNISTASNSTSLATNITSNAYGKGKALVPNSDDFLQFTLLNSISFVASLAMIIVVLPTRRYSLFLYIYMFLFMVTYLAAMGITSRSLPETTTTYSSAITIASCSIVCVVAFMKCFLILCHVLAARLSTGNNNAYSLYEIMTRLSFGANMIIHTASTDLIYKCQELI